MGSVCLVCIGCALVLGGVALMVWAVVDFLANCWIYPYAQAPLLRCLVRSIVTMAVGIGVVIGVSLAWLSAQRQS